ncbi:MAG: hypothetical protein WAW96_09820 [Alphaproteobacteria bacterium]
MAEVVGGKTTSIVARIAEVAAWFPVLMVLTAAGGMSLVNNMHMVELPGWVQSGLEIYDKLRDQLIKITIGRTIHSNYADAAIMGLGLLTMLSRRVLGFLFSIGGFIVLAGVAWFLLHKYA